MRLILENKYNNIDFSKRPFQTLRTVFDFRNARAHSKTIFTKLEYQEGDKSWHENLEKRWIKVRKMHHSKNEAARFINDTLSCINRIEDMSGIKVRAEATFNKKHVSPH